jgi:outer membrane lipoprotein SlyB
MSFGAMAQSSALAIAEPWFMISLHRLLPVSVLVLAGALAACAPAAQNSTVSPYAVGAQGYVTYGTIVGTRPVTVTGTRSGLGLGAGAISGGLIGSTVGRGWQANTLGGVAGALIGGLAGAAIEEGVTSGQAVEFTIQEDGGQPIAVVQTNELALQVGERVAISRTDRVRLSRAAVPPPSVGGYPSGPGAYPAGK